MHSAWPRQLLSVLITSASTILPATAQPAFPADTAAIEEIDEIDEMFAPWDRRDTPGAAVLVIRDGKVLHRKGYGMADLEHRIPIGPDTVFDLASVSKQFCGLAIAMLVEQGRLKTTDDVRKHVPWVPTLAAAGTPPVPIRIRHLLHHTSGIRDWPGALRLAGWSYEDVISFEQILRMLRNQRDLNFVPGTEYSYSNTGYNLLAHVVEKVSGTTFAAWTRKQLFDPLGMRSTHFQDDHTRVIPKRAQAYRAVQGQWHRVTNQLTALGSSSLFSTIDDLARWIDNFETQKVGGKAALARMHTPGRLRDGRALAYCYGVNAGRHRGLATLSHSGSWAGFRTMLLRYPEQRFAVVILANTAQVQPRQKARAIASHFLEEQMQPAPDATPGALTHAKTDGWQPKGLGEFAGAYRSEELETTYRVVPAGGNLELTHFRNGTVTLRPSSTVDRFGSRASWVSTLRFVREKGVITGFEVTNGRCRHVRFTRLREQR